jgi:cytochrome c-type biogenesis protein CcmH/NrfG
VLGGTWNLSTAAVSAKSREEITQGILQNSTSNLPGRARKLLEADPDDPESAIILVDLLLAAERYRDLESAAAQAMQSCGDDPEALNGLAWLLVSASDSPRVPLDTALLAATRAVQLSGRRSEMLETLARVHFRRRSIREAVTIQREAVAGAALPRRPLLEAILRDYEQQER